MDLPEHLRKRYTEKAEACMFYGEPVKDFDRDDLLAFAGAVVADCERLQKELDNIRDMF